MASSFDSQLADRLGLRQTFLSDYRRRGVISPELNQALLTTESHTKNSVDTYEQGVMDLLICIQNYSSGDGLRASEDIAHLKVWVHTVDQSGESPYFGMSYQDGVKDTLLWLLGKISQRPDDALVAALSSGA